MSYCRIEPDFYSVHGIIENPVLADDVSFLEGIPITQSLPAPLEFKISNPESEPPGHFLGDEIPVVSDVFAAGLRANGVDNFQLFPALLRNEEGRVYDNYYAFNVVGLLDAVDISGSSADVIMSDSEKQPLVDYETLRFDAAKARGSLLFRLVQSPIHIYLATHILDRMESNKPDTGWGITAIVVEAVE